jgi:uncharacterized paraquat-inducible protein A
MRTADVYCAECKVLWDLSELPRTKRHLCWFCHASLVELRSDQPRNPVQATSEAMPLLAVTPGEPERRR